jgi:EAL domain-containing protein (putative c-di-GMP-specific phosphodiesterase class I)
MAKSLGMRVIGEGIETQQQLEYLQQNGCDVVQGFFTG